MSRLIQFALFVISEEANDIACASSRIGAPRLTSDSDRETVLSWLQWCDPNGCHTDALAQAEDFEPLTLIEAWEAVERMIEDAS